MSQKSEHISALMDGEQQDQTSIDALLNDPQELQTWQRYHLIRDGLRKELPTELNFDISANVAKALEQEMPIVAPKKRKITELPVIANVIPLVRQGGQFAVAASVAAVMILGVQQFNQPAVEEQPFNTAPVLRVPGIQGGMSPVSLEQSRALPNQDASEQRRRINAYLMDHQQQMRFKANTSESEEKQGQDAESSPE